MGGLMFKKNRRVFLQMKRSVFMFLSLIILLFAINTVAIYSQESEFESDDYVEDDYSTEETAEDEAEKTEEEKKKEEKKEIEKEIEIIKPNSMIDRKDKGPKKAGIDEDEPEDDFIKSKTDGPEEQNAPLMRKGTGLFIENARFSMAGGMLTSLGAFHESLPMGFPAFISYESNESASYSWDIRLEAGYMYFRNNEKLLHGFNVGIGPIWLLPFFGKKVGHFVLSTTFGASFLKIESNKGEAQTNPFTAQVSVGYEFPFLLKFKKRHDQLFMFLIVRSFYLLGKEKPILNAGGYFGVGYKIGRTRLLRF